MDTPLMLARIGTRFLNALVRYYGPERAAEMLEQWAAQFRTTGVSRGRTSSDSH